MKRLIERPGYFGRRRDEKVAAYDSKYGKGKWRLCWLDGDGEAYEFRSACRYFYERSYFEYLKDRKDDVDFICSFGECIDNAPTNVDSGLDYSQQEAFSTHIQDIAIRNVLWLLGRKFEGPKDKILIIRSADSEGFRFGPGNVPFMNQAMIDTSLPTICPSWANKGSVEHFWQHQKWVEAIK